MNPKYLYYVTFFAIIHIGCRSKKDVDHKADIPAFDLTNLSETIEPFQLSKIAKSITYIPLETNDSLLLKYIRKIIKVGDSYFVLSGNSIVRFNDEGMFLSKLERIGKGPGEYSGINDFDIDPTGRIIAISTWGKIMFYNLDGSFIKLIDCNVNYINFIDNKKLLTYRNNMLGGEKYSNLIMNIEGDTIAKFPNRFKFELKNSSVNLPNWEFIHYRFGNNLFVSEIQDDTLFKVTENNTLSPYMIFNTGKHRITKAARADGAYFQKHFIDFIYLTCLMESNRYLYYSFSGRGHLYDKRDQITYALKGFENDIDGGAKFYPQYAFGNNNFISIIEVTKLKERIEEKSFKDTQVKDQVGKRNFEQFVSGLFENGNPVIMMVKLRE